MYKGNRLLWRRILGALGCLWGSAAFAMPVTIGYVGQIEKSDGSAYQGATIPMLHVGLYDGKTATAKLVYGLCNYADLPVTDGVFVVEIGGAECPAAPNVVELLASGIPLYVGFEIGGSTLLPYQPMLPVPYALIALEALDASQLGGKTPESYATVDWANVTFATKASLASYLLLTTASQVFATKAELADCWAASTPCVGKSNGAACDDGNPCTLESTCQNQQCKPVAGKNAPNGTVCSDGNKCLTDQKCTNGFCAGSSVNCNDNNPCTADACAPTIGCYYTFAGATALCSDGDLCTSGDKCVSGLCVGSPNPCSSANPCIDKICNPADGLCYSTPPKADGTPCEDGNPCTDCDTCQDGQCTSGLCPLTECIDGNICTLDGCNLNPGSGPLCVWVADPNQQGKPCLTKAGTTGICVGTICAIS